jgi:ERF superfamily
MCSDWRLIVHSSSESIGTIAAALAKAQVELTNPEKSLVATIRSPFPREGERTFRYAPLSSGLDIVRKGLGRHEIATIQATAIDKDAGLLRLTTVLAHSSGEWISSEWPVCQIADIASAQRMGAALTYARRYALFTLVGIAGEDDLDAPDLGMAPKVQVELPQSDHPSQSDGYANVASRPSRAGGDLAGSGRPVLAPDQSATLREQLLAELSAFNSADDATAWAYQNLPAKNSLTAADAQIVEARFRQRFATIDDGAAAEGPSTPGPDEGALAAGGLPTAVPQRPRAAALRALGKAVRLRNKEHRKFVTRQPCLVCGRVPSDPHHLTFAQPRALGHRVSDEFTVPVCRIHHRELHRSGDEAAWWQKLNIDPLPVALKLWQHSQTEVAPSPVRKGVTEAQAAKTQDVRVQDRRARDWMTAVVIRGWNLSKKIMCACQLNQRGFPTVLKPSMSADPR